MRAIVVGAGIIGAGVAFRLAEAGAKVTIIEAGRVGGGTSGTSFSWTNARDKTPRPYFDLNLAGMRAHEALREEFGAAPWLHQTGSIQWANDPAKVAKIAARIATATDWGYLIHTITRAELAELEPDIDLGSVGDGIITFSPADGWIDPVVYADAMVKAAQKRGAALLTNLKVTAVESRAGTVTGVTTADGALHEADIVVNCAGRWADILSDDPSLRIPLKPTVGFLVFSPPVATAIARPLHAPTVHLRPDGAGRLMLRENDMDEAVTLDTPATPGMPQAIEIMRRAARYIPALKGVAPEATRITARPIPEDGFSCVGPVPRAKNYYVVVTHSGVTLAPFLAKAAADEIVHGRDCAALKDFRPARFFN